MVEQLQRKSIQRITLAALGLITFAYYTLYITCSEHYTTSDDLTLFNPVFTYLQTGHLHYPIYGSDEIIMVHPPVQYYMVAQLIKAGVNTQLAYALPFLASLLLLLAVNTFSSVQFTKRVAIICAVQFPLVFKIGSIRPDVTIATLWLASLILFDWWNEKRERPLLLFFSALVLAFSSTLHYYATFGLIGAGVYLYVCIAARHNNSVFKKNIAALAAGLGVVLLPYYLGFVVPNLQGIMNHVQNNQGPGGVLEAIQKHIELYQKLSDYPDFHYGNTTLFLLALKISYKFNLFLAITSVILLYLRKEMRLIALAAAPLLLVILFYSKGKTDGYLMPEFLFFVFAVAYYLFIGIKNFLQKDSPFLKYTALILGLVLISPVFSNAIKVTLYTFPFSIRNLEMHTTRNCAKQIVGDNAYIGGRISAWYIGGSQTWKDLNVDLFDSVILPPKDSLKRYFTQFTAVAETRHVCEYPANDKSSSLSCFYLDSTLQLKGFIFSDNGEYYSELSTAFFCADTAATFKGYIVTGGKDVKEITADVSGDMVFVSAAVKGQDISLDSLQLLMPGMVAFNFFVLPFDNQLTPAGGAQKIQNIMFMVVPKREVESAAAFMKQHILVRDIISCRLLPKNDLLRYNFASEKLMHYKL